MRPQKPDVTGAQGALSQPQLAMFLLTSGHLADKGHVASFTVRLYDLGLIPALGVANRAGMADSCLLANFLKPFQRLSFMLFLHLVQIKVIYYAKLHQRGGTTMTERLDCSPPTVANRVQSPAGLLRIFASGNRARTMPLVGGGFLGDLPFPPPPNSGAAPYSPQTPKSALKTSLLRAANISSLTQIWITHRNRAHLGRGGVAIRLLASYQGQPGSIPSGVAPGFSDATGQLVFSGISHFPRPCIPASYRFTLIDSQDFRVKSRSNLSTQVLGHGGSAARALVSHKVETDSIPGMVAPADIRTWESWRTVTLVSGFSRGSPISPVLCIPTPLHTSILSLIGSQDPRC
ncbi:hypothetical protein PR048_025395 [Dryococelus australis]|uniref:Uncharacterized protein n=1 Tax=Dryococelus australis TaxID=614101 RepID=A0ABQ9GR83_9NEOP|nr:hypothetical protein PR048_025395 [Dryococelus australis]